jgi:hypothetical protein
MAKFTTDKSLTYVSIALAHGASQEVLLKPSNLTEVLRRALIVRPGEAGALGTTWIVREVAERQAARFCQARPVVPRRRRDTVHRARVYELPGDRWGVVVWYEMVD